MVLATRSQYLTTFVDVQVEFQLLINLTVIKNVARLFGLNFHSTHD